MPVWTRKAIVLTKPLTALKDILPLLPLGFPCFTHCTPAHGSDDAGLVAMFTLNIAYCKAKPLALPKLTILLEHGYHPDCLTQALEPLDPEIRTKIKFELATQPAKQEKVTQGKVGLVPAVARWVMERSNAWMERCKSWVKHFERTLAKATTKLNLCFVRLMLKRLAASP